MNLVFNDNRNGNGTHRYETSLKRAFPANVEADVDVLPCGLLVGIIHAGVADGADKR